MGAVQRFRAMASAAVVMAVGAGIAPQNASAEPAAALAPRTELEAAAQELLAPVTGRHVLRSPDGGLELWLISDQPFEKSVAELRRAASASSPSCH